MTEWNENHPNLFAPEPLYLTPPGPVGRDTEWNENQQTYVGSTTCWLPVLNRFYCPPWGGGRANSNTMLADVNGDTQTQRGAAYAEHRVVRYSPIA